MRCWISSLFFMCLNCSSLCADAALLQVLGVGQAVIFASSTSLNHTTVGQWTHDILQQAFIDKQLKQYQGSASGVITINGLGRAYEVLSNTQLNAYGWCFRVDGYLSKQLAHQHRLTGQEKLIQWFYAYAHLDKATWESMCIPADHRPEQGL